MNRYKAITATTNKTEEAWGGTSEFTNRAITQLAWSAKGKPVLLGFDDTKILGSVESASVENGRLIIIFTLNCDIVSKECRLVPGYIVNNDTFNSCEPGCHRVVDEAESMSYGLTVEPVETDLPEIECVYEDNRPMDYKALDKLVRWPGDDKDGE